MKKLIVLSLCGLLIIAFSATVYAQKLDFRASGFIDFIGVYDKNTPRYNAGAGTFQVVNPDYGYRFTAPAGFNDPKALDRRQSFWTSRMRLKFDAVMDKNLSGTIFFEADSSRWGDISGGQGAKLREAGAFGYWSADRVALEIKNVYVDFGLPYFGIPVPISFRVGLQPLAIRPNMFVYTDGMGVTMNMKVAGMINIQPMWFKALEGKDWAEDDVDIYGIQANAKIKTITIGGYGLYYNMNSYPFTVGTAVGAAVAGLPTLYGLVQGTYQSGMYWLGAYADGKAGPVNMNFDFIYSGGKVERNPQNVVALTAPFPDVKYSGWATRAKIDFPWEKFNFGVVGMFASGADAKKTSASGLPGTTVAYGAGGFGPYGATFSTKNKAFVVPPGSEQGPIFQEAIVVYNSIFGDSEPLGIGDNANYNALSRGGIGGTAMAKLYTSVKATPWYKITLQGLYVWDTTKNGNTFGNAVKMTGLLRDDKDVGFELDLINYIDIYKNLTFSFGGGYLWAGGAMDLRDRGLLAIPNTNFSPKNPWVIATKLLYTF
jgi:hypothetical protein